MMEKFFKLKESGTTVSTEILAGLTTFFAMVHILFVNPALLSQTGIPYGAVFLATIFASVIGTLVMALFANVPYAQAPGMGLNAFFTYTVCFGLGFTWQEALAMVFLCGIINIIITVTKIRKSIIKAIPESLQNAISGGIGVFVAYVGIKNANLLKFTSDLGTYQELDSGTVISNSGIVPALAEFNNPGVLLAIISLAITVILVLKKVPGAVFIGIIISTLIGIPMGVVDISQIGVENNLSKSFSELGTTFGAAFSSKGMGSLFSDSSRLPLVIMTIFSFSLSDTFDTLGTFIGTGRRTGIFSEEDLKAMDNSNGFKSKMDRALFADSIATSIGAVFGTSNTTTYVESAAGIGAGGRTGLTSLVVAIMFLLSMIFAPVISIVPKEATASALILVGIMMMSSFSEIRWTEIEEALPAFFAGIFMGICYSISYGIATGFIFYCFTKCLKKEAKDIHPILWVSTGLFILNFILLAII
ncbi:NCS2 family permease [Muricomes intestini]|jgi:AGZA family xanthine/uracil permease-like MFS transporter|uniref:AGZA family xanthine/uracil permease-like MFS transporter n=1 Tax=Muricomes intestini TaxID=1796634 RepID=A0A4R3K3W9_9FIRM|nr:AGZA family xanthine/uracil permease-like MFS transporter [Muricomes intestini]